MAGEGYGCCHRRPPSIARPNYKAPKISTSTVFATLTSKNVSYVLSQLTRILAKSYIPTTLKLQEANVDKRVRSPNYPSMSLPDAIQKAALVYMNQHTMVLLGKYWPRAWAIIA